MSEFSIKTFKARDKKCYEIKIDKVYGKDEMIHLANMLLDMVDNGRGN